MLDDPNRWNLSPTTGLATSTVTDVLLPRVMSSTTTPSTPTTSATSNDDNEESVSHFFMHKGAMAGVFTAAGILLILIGVIIHMAWMRRRRRIRITKDAEVHVGHGRAGSPSAFSYVEPAPISRPSPSLRFSFGSGADRWWTGGNNKRRSRGSSVGGYGHGGGFDSGDGRGFSQDFTPLRLMENMDRETVKSSDSIIGSTDLMTYRPSAEVNNELGHIYGRVRGIADSPPPAPSPSPLVITTPTYSSTRTIIHGRQTTLEDALLPTLSSSAYQIQLSGQHPYAQGR